MKTRISLLLGAAAIAYGAIGVEAFVQPDAVGAKISAAPSVFLLTHLDHENLSACQRSHDMSLSLQSDQSVDGKKESKISSEIFGVGVWIVAVSSFILANNYAGPWPAGLDTWFPYSVWLLIHAISGMLFSGGVILTTLIEWMVVATATKKNASEDSVLPVLKFWFDQVPTLDLAVVVPSLTFAIFSGIGLASVNYVYLGDAPIHVKASLHALVTFAIWWASTDLTTQGAARDALLKVQQDQENASQSPEQVPRVILFRRISNIVSCAFVLILYGLMILKPGSQ